MENLPLKDVIKSLEKKYGEGTLIKCDSNKKVNIETITTRSISLDDALGIGGIPVGRIIEIYGPESSGKTTLCLTIVAEAQKMKKQCAYIDAEHSLDLDYAKNLGVNLKELYLSQPNSGEQALETVEQLVRTNEIGVIVVDSVAALTPQAEIDGEMGKQHIGLQARLMSQALRKLTAIAAQTKTTIIFINQIRMKIGVIYGSPEVTTGGTALKYYCSMRIEIRRAAKLKKGNEGSEEIVGNRTVVKVVKNKLAAPFKTTTFDIYYNKGISIASDVISFGLIKKILRKEGTSIYFGEEKLGRSAERAREYLEENKPTLEKIIFAIKNKTADINDTSDTESTEEIEKV